MCPSVPGPTSRVRLVPSLSRTGLSARVSHVSTRQGSPDYPPVSILRMRFFRVRYTSLKNSRKVFRIPFTSVNIGRPEISLNSSPNSSEIFILPSESNKSASESADLEGFAQFSQACMLMMLGSGSEARIIFYISLKSIKDLSFCIEVVFIKKNSKN